MPWISSLAGPLRAPVAICSPVTFRNVPRQFLPGPVASSEKIEIPVTHSASPVAPLTILRYLRTRAKQSRANADFGSAFFDRSLKIVAHAHG